MYTHQIAYITSFNNEAFEYFRFILVGEMKSIQSQGIGSKTKKAEPLTEVKEELLWKKRAFGDCTPQILLDTMILGSLVNLQIIRSRAPRRRAPYLQYTEYIYIYI